MKLAALSLTVLALGACAAPPTIRLSRNGRPIEPDDDLHVLVAKGSSRQRVRLTVLHRQGTIDEPEIVPDPRGYGSVEVVLNSSRTLDLRTGICPLTSGFARPVEPDRLYIEAWIP